MSRDEATARPDRKEDYADLKDALSFWLTPERTNRLGIVVAKYLHEYRTANNGQSPAWGQTLRETDVIAPVPFPPPDDYNAAERQRWRNVKYSTVMDACRKLGWVKYGHKDGGLAPGPRWQQFMMRAAAQAPRR